MKRFLVTHDYGMGALYWWIEAPSAEAIIQTYAEVGIVDLDAIDPDAYANTPSLRIGDPAPPGLDGLEEKRRLQHGKPGYGALIGRGSVYTRQEYADEQETYFTEYDAEGYRTRQVVLLADGTLEKSTAEDWFFNPPEDLWNPDLAAREISREEFETQWSHAVPMPRDEEE